MVTTVEMPERWAPKAALRDRGDLIGLVAASPLGKDSILQRGMLVPPPELGPGEREVAILVDAETGVAGKVGPGASVDIVATFEAEDRRPAESRVVVPGARIVEVGNAQLAGGGGLREREVDPEQVVPVTFALTQDDALEVTYAESFATEVRLALLRPDEDSGAEADETFYERERRTRRAGT
jgi:pilus assembly protein CpaB